MKSNKLTFLGGRQKQNSSHRKRKITLLNILASVETKLQICFQDIDMPVLDDESMIAIQMTIMGLTITEWMAKLREEFLTYDLVTAMAVDFFFAYDVIDFVMMLHNDYHVFQTDWMLVFENESLT